MKILNIATNKIDINLFLATSFIGLCWLQIKNQLLNGSSGLTAFARMLGLERNGLDFFGVLSLYISDFLVCSLLIPIILSYISKNLANNIQRAFSILLILLLLLFYFTYSVTLANVGAFINLDLIVESILWGLQQPSVINDYLSIYTLAKFILALSISIYILRINLSPHIKKIITCYKSILFILVPLFIYGIHTKFLSYSIGEPAVKTAIQSLFDSRTEYVYKAKNLDDLQSMFDVETGIIRTGPNLTNKKNVIFFIMETAPYRLYPEQMIHSDLKKIVGDGYLYSMKNHHSTYPYTSDGIYSILTSLYPEGRRRVLKTDNSPIEFGWLSQLVKMGHVTTNYSPLPDVFEPDEIMYSKFGVINRVVYGKNTSEQEIIANMPDNIVSLARDSTTLTALQKDYFVVERATKDAVELSKQDRNFVFLLTPNIGHSPWADLSVPESSKATITEKIWHAQYLMLSRMINELKINNVLKDTVIVLTSDHGVRTKQEYDGFELGRITDLSYKVPMLIYSSTALPIADTQRMSSHVDIGPSVLEWLGVGDSRKFVEGQSFSSTSASRTIYFFGRNYIGVEGFYQNGLYYSYNKNTSMCESTADFKWSSSQTSTLCQEKLANFYKIHNSVINRYVYSE